MPLPALQPEPVTAPRALTQALGQLWGCSLRISPPARNCKHFTGLPPCFKSFTERNPCRGLCATDISHARVQACPVPCRNEENIKTLQCSPSFGLCCWTPQLYDFNGCILSKTSCSWTKQWTLQNTALHGSSHPTAVTDNIHALLLFMNVQRNHFFCFHKC